MQPHPPAADLGLLTHVVWGESPAPIIVHFANCPIAGAQQRYYGAPDYEKSI
jgi:hypothetical protein